MTLGSPCVLWEVLSAVPSTEEHPKPALTPAGTQQAPRAHRTLQDAAVQGVWPAPSLSTRGRTCSAARPRAGARAQNRSRQGDHARELGLGFARRRPGRGPGAMAVARAWVCHPESSCRPLRTCWISSSVSGWRRPGSRIGKAVRGSSTVSRYRPRSGLAAGSPAPETPRTGKLAAAPSGPGRRGDHGGPQRLRAEARGAAPGRQAHSPQCMAPLSTQAAAVPD